MSSGRSSLRVRRLIGVATGVVIPVVFATVVSAVATFELYLERLRVEPQAPAPITLRQPALRLAEVGKGGAMTFTRSSILVPRGHRVEDPEEAALVRAYETARRASRWQRTLLSWLVLFLFALVVGAALARLSPARGVLLRTQLGFFTAIACLLTLCKVSNLLTDWSILWLPVAALPMWLSTHLDRRAAYAASVLLTVGSLALVHWAPIHPVVVGAACFLASSTPRDRRRDYGYIYGGAAAALGGVSVYLLVRGVLGPGLFWEKELSLGFHSSIVASAGGGLMAAGFGMAFQRPFAALLGIPPRSQLIDLTDVDHSLLKRLANEAPGTWQHSRAMANLAEAAAAAIGADSLLVRVGAYFHDIGKSVEPKYFVENLEPGETSPHDSIEPDASATAIVAHVTAGTRILRDAGLPESIVEFVYTHHGTSVVEYFWHKCLEQGNPKGYTEAFFRYPGMKPRSRETAILMLVDSIEAASRTVTPPERSKFEVLVRRIVFTKLRQGQLDHSGLEMRELKIIVGRVTDALCGLYHGRVRYPWQDEEGGEDEGEVSPALPKIAGATRAAGATKAAPIKLVT